MNTLTWQHDLKAEAFFERLGIVYQYDKAIPFIQIKVENENLSRPGETLDREMVKQMMVAIENEMPLPAMYHVDASTS